MLPMNERQSATGRFQFGLRSLGRLGVIAIICAQSLACGSPSQVPAQRYELKGKVVSVDKQRRQVSIAHEAIPGLMEAMTMPFTVKDKWALDVLAPGDYVTATLVVEGERSWIESPVITKDSLPAPGPSNTSGALGPKPGDEVPDFPLRNQDGRPIRLHQYRGRALLLTFIYTRCPLPDYCPLMSNHFAEIAQALREQPALQAKTHLLSISVDPQYDTPQVLRAYGARYAGSAAFRHWEFATGTAQEVKEVAQFFGLSYWTEKDQIIHSLSTAIIAPDGKVFKFYRGNEWKSAEVLSDLRSLELAETARNG
jgi:protein SCO1/2